MRFRAFTILELLTVMLITSLVISAGYLTLNVMGFQFELFKSSTEKNEELYRLEYLLKTDFNNASEVIRTAEGIEIRDTFPVIYVVTYKRLIRTKNEIVDSFNYAIKDIIYSFEGRTIEYSGELVDRIYFVIRIGDLEIPFIAKKWYAGNVLFKNDDR